MNHMLIGRLIVAAICIYVAYYFAFKRTPELDGVEHAWWFRLCYGMLILRGVFHMLFEVCGLFPLEVR